MGKGLGRGIISREELGKELAGQGLLFCCSIAERRRVIEEFHRIGRIVPVERSEGRAEQRDGITGAPFPDAFPMLQRALHVQAMVGIDIPVPAQAGRVVPVLALGQFIPFAGLQLHFIQAGVVVIAVFVLSIGKHKLPIQRLVVAQLVGGPQVEALHADVIVVGAAIAAMIEPGVLARGQAETQGALAPAETVAGVTVANAALAVGISDLRTQRLMGLEGNDVDHAGQGIGPVTDGVGPAKHFDALDVFQRHRQILPVDLGEAGAIDRAPVDQDLHAAGLRGMPAVVVDLDLDVVRNNDQPRHQPQQLGEFPRAARLDELTVQHADAARNRGG